MNVLDCRSVHFVGVGGAGMSPLAELLARAGVSVSGSDLLESETTRHLTTAGVRLLLGHHEHHVGDVDAVVYSAAIRPENPEMVAARRRGIPLVRRAELLGSLMREKRGVAISGAHGKTTTTAMIGAVLTRASLDPTVIVGGSFRGGGSNLRVGRGEILVAEADEFDRAFHALSPRVAVITNIDLEHLDTYRDLEDLEQAFVHFGDSVPRDGAVIAGIESASVAAIVPRLGRRLVTFGIGEASDFGARDLRVTPERTRFVLLVSGRQAAEVALRVPGAHNVRNALAALAAAREMGASLEAAVAGLAEFHGMARRFEMKGQHEDVVVVDDYAHHPTEIAATLCAARELHPRRRVVVVFQPHLYSRTRDFAKEFGEALATADLALIAPIYPARERPIPGITSASIRSASRPERLRALSSDEAVGTELEAMLRPGDLLLTLGAGDVARFGEAWLQGRQSRHG
jgi:UDP-N-acetylmuramate--alanine ligase